MSLTTEDRNKIYNRMRYFRMGGDPVTAFKLKAAMDADEMPDPSLMSDTGVQTDTPLKGTVDLTLPPRHGKGSGVAKWREFAALVTDIDTEVLQRMDRDDIIEALEAKGNIPKAGDD